MDYNKYCYEIAEVVLILMEKRSIRVENKFFKEKDEEELHSIKIRISRNGMIRKYRSINRLNQSVYRVFRQADADLQRIQQRKINPRITRHLF